MHIALDEEVAGITQCLVRIEMRAAQNASEVGLDSLRLITITQLDRLTLPKLTLGANEILLRADEQVETTELWPALHDRAYRQSAVEEDGVFSDKQPDGMYKATLGAAMNSRECSVTWRLMVPTDITSVTYGVIGTNRSAQSWVSLRRSWDGTNFEQFHLNSDEDFPFDEQILQRFDDTPKSTRQAYFRSVFFCKSGAATYNMPGIQYLLIRVCHRPRDATFQPILVTYSWTEHRAESDVTRSHTEVVESLPHRYTINVAGRRDPTMHWVRMTLQGNGPDGHVEYSGYSDGIDVGPGWERPKVVYCWGKNLAHNKSYTASRTSSLSSGIPDSDGRELTNSVIIAPTDYVRDKTVQAATAFWDPGEPVTFVVDLQEQARIAGVRVSTHQPNARFCHPASIKVAVSDDGQQWHSVGAIRHDDLWHPPGDYEPWEHDDSPAYASLPACGRLAYSFPLVFAKPLTGRYVRCVCEPLDGKGMGISELQVFDRAVVSPWPADIRMLEQAPDRKKIP